MPISAEFKASYVICTGLAECVGDIVGESRHDLHLENNSTLRVVDSETMSRIIALRLELNRVSNRDLIIANTVRWTPEG